MHLPTARHIALHKLHGEEYDHIEPVWGLLNEGLRGNFSFRRSRKIIA